MTAPTGRGGRSAAKRPEIRTLVSMIRSGEALHPRNDYENRLACAIVRYVNELGPGDVPDEYAEVAEAMRSSAAGQECPHIKRRTIRWGIASTKEWCSVCKRFVQHDIDWEGHP